MSAAGTLIRARLASFGAETSAPEVIPPAGGKACASLPSSTAAARLVSGDMGAIPAVLGTFLARAGLLAGAMALAGEREHLGRNALAGAMGIEVFVLSYTALKQKGKI